MPVPVKNDTNGLPRCSIQELREMVDKFETWLTKAGYASYDPYDIWGTQYGKWARKLYYDKNPLGLILSAPIILMEIFWPSLRALFVRKERFATADAQLLLAFLLLCESCRAEAGRGREAKYESTFWLSKAKELAEDLKGYAIPGYSGMCWGYPFDWQNVTGLVRKNTPLITATPYCYEAFLKLYEVTADKQYLDIVRSIADFIYKDLGDTSAGENAAAGSYYPGDSSKVINASAYRAYVLFDAAQRFGSVGCRDKAWKNLKFILQSQRPDGSWLYAIDSPGEEFIDHFHTCFVLKNLYKIDLLIKEPAVSEAIQKGYAYYRRELFDTHGNPKSYAIEPRLQLSTLEMYNVAEAISLGVLLRERIAEASDLANDLACRLRSKYQTRKGYFITREYVGGITHKVPYMRWAQAQIFFAVASLFLARNVSRS